MEYFEKTVNSKKNVFKMGLDPVTNLHKVSYNTVIESYNERSKGTHQSNCKARKPKVN